MTAFDFHSLRTRVWKGLQGRTQGPFRPLCIVITLCDFSTDKSRPWRLRLGRGMLEWETVSGLCGPIRLTSCRREKPLSLWPWVFIDVSHVHKELEESVQFRPPPLPPFTDCMKYKGINKGIKHIVMTRIAVNQLISELNINRGEGGEINLMKIAWSYKTVQKFGVNKIFKKRLLSKDAFKLIKWQ